MKSSNSGPVVLQNAAAADGNGTKLLLDGFNHVIISITGTFNASVHLEITIDDVNWFEISASDLTTTNPGTKVKTITAPTITTCDLIGGATYFRTRISNYVSGAVTCIANAHAG